MIGYYVNKSHSIYIAPVRILNSDEFPERQSGKLIISIVMDCINNLLFTLLQIVANDEIISHIVIMILIKADLTNGVGGGGGERECIRNKVQEDFVTRL